MQDQQLTPEALAAIDKVAKLLTLARDKRGNEHESQNALDMAHKILEQHNLDMALVERKAGDSANPHAKRDDKTSGGGLYKWQRMVWEYTARLNMCVYIPIRGLRAGEKYENRLIGKPENVLMTRLMAEYLQDTIERLAAEWAAAQGYKSRFVREAIIYREGMANNISYRLMQLHNERVEQSKREASERAAAARHPASAGATGTSIVLASVIQTEADLNNDYVCGYKPGTTSQARAEREARVAAYMAEEERKRVEHERRYAEDDEYAAQYDAEQAEELRLQQRRARDEAKRASRRRMPTYRENASDRRKAHPAYYEGYDKGDEVSLSRQVEGTDTTKKLK